MNAPADALMRVARVLNEPLDAVSVCQRIVEQTLTLLPIRFSAITLLEPDGGLRTVARRGVPLLAGAPAVLPRGVGVTGRAVVEGQPRWSRDIRADKRFRWPPDIRDRLVASGHRALLAVTLQPRGRIIGALTVADRRVRDFTRIEIRLVQAFAHHAAIALANAQLHQTVERRRDEAEQSKAALRQSERRYTLLAENMADVVTLIDMSLRPVYVSPSVLRLRGYTPEEAMAQTLEERVTPASAALVTRTLSEELAIEAAGPPDLGRTRTLELELLCRDGSTVWVETTTGFQRDEAGRASGIIAVSRNVTERKRAEVALRETEARLRQARRMEAIGQLASGIAHDFNNLLMVMLARAGAILSRLSAHDPVHDDVEIILKTVERATRLARQLLALSRRPVLQPTVLDLNQIVTGAAPILRTLVGDSIELVMHLDRNLGAVRVDSAQIEQIIVNLAANARDAMPEGGRLVIATANVELDGVFAAANPGAVPGEYVLLEVSDTGAGMTPEVQARVFEPFFTTKGIGEGTGLGLATVYGIVKQHGGYIAVESTLGHGTIFRVYLPRREFRGAAEAPPAPAQGT